MNRFQKILNEAFHPRSQAEETWRLILAWTRGIQGCEVRVGEGATNHLFITITKTQEQNLIGWDPQSDQLLDDGDEWADEEEDEEEIFVEVWDDEVVIGIPASTYDYHVEEDTTLSLDDFSAIQSTILDRVNGLKE